MKKFINPLLFALAIYLAPGCSPYQYYSIQSSNASFGKYRTFAWLPPADTVKNSRYNDIADERITGEVTGQLEKRGLILKANHPDLLVRYSIAVNDKVRLYNNQVYIYNGHRYYYGAAQYHGRYYYNYRAPYPIYVGSEIEQVPYKEGSLIIDLIDQRTSRVIWRGYGRGEVDNPERAINDIPEVVGGILKKLPILPLPK
ncbi:MAG: DUF4136 domain-containing protein [Bacteroidetes bacterium]|jgi:hypothetical protein|nr:DUF4136 domain-containing protein [Bacteroidota bacterium]